MKKNCTLIINPVSGKYSETKVSTITTTLAAHGYEPEVLLTGGPDDAPLFAREICERESDPLIVAGGGDGTINGVVNGMLPEKGTLAILPLGTANVLARELRIGSIDDAVRRIIRGESRILPIGLATGEGAHRRFLLMAGVGFDARVVESVRPSEKKALKQGAYLFAGMRCLLSWEREMLTVTGDDEAVRCHSVVVCNAPSYGGSFRLAPGVDFFTPGFEAVCITGDTRTALMALVAATVAGFRGAVPGVHRLTSRSFTIEGRKPVQLDGDSLGSSPLTLTTLPGFARIIV